MRPSSAARSPGPSSRSERPGAPGRGWRCRAGLILALCLPAAAAAAPALGALGVTRLWVETREGPAPVCTAAYVRDPLDRLPSGTAWVLTAGHCLEDGAARLGRDRPQGRFTALPWRERGPGHGPGARAPDLAVAAAPTPGGAGSALSLAERMPREGPIWLHGFPYGIEHLTAGRLVGDSLERPGSVEIKLVVGPVTDAGPGLSGAPVVDAQGRVVGVLWGLRAEGLTELRAFAIPVEVVRDLLGRLPAPSGRDSR